MKLTDREVDMLLEAVRAHLDEDGMPYDDRPEWHELAVRLVRTQWNRRQKGEEQGERLNG